MFCRIDTLNRLRHYLQRQNCLGKGGTKGLASWKGSLNSSRLASKVDVLNFELYESVAISDHNFARIAPTSGCRNKMDTRSHTTTAKGHDNLQQHSLHAKILSASDSQGRDSWIRLQHQAHNLYMQRHAVTLSNELRDSISDRRNFAAQSQLAIKKH